MLHNKKLRSFGPPAFILSLAACFMLLIYAPCEYYFANKDEFLYDIYNLLSVMLPVFFLCLFICFSVLLFSSIISIKLHNMLMTFGVISLLILYIQGTFFSAFLPTLENTDVDWGLYSDQRYVSIVIIVCVTMFIILIRKFLLHDNMNRFIFGISLCLFLILLSAGLIDSFTSNGFINKEDEIITDTGFMQMSSDENLIILLYDAVSGDAFSHLCNSHPEYSNILEDFTFFPDTLSGYPYTMCSIPFLLTGQWYEADIPFSQYRNNAYNSAQFFSSLKGNGYSLSFYDHDMISVSSIKNLINNIAPSSGLAYPWKFAVMQLELVGFRYLPFDLKRFSMIDSYSMYLDTFMKCNTGTEYFEQLENVYNLVRSPVSITDEKQFKYIYTVGAHVPFGYDSEVKLSENADYESCIEACMTITAAYLDNLKRNGVYDNSVILVISDHGFNGDGINTGRQNSLLLVKGRNESHPFSVSDIPVSQEHFTSAYSLLLDGRQAIDSFSSFSASACERRFLLYDVDYPYTFEEYICTGKAYDTDSLISTGNSFRLK